MGTVRIDYFVSDEEEKKLNVAVGKRKNSPLPPTNHRCRDHEGLLLQHQNCGGNTGTPIGG